MADKNCVSTAIFLLIIVYKEVYKENRHNKLTPVVLVVQKHIEADQWKYWIFV